jgi:hypothetical protein
LTELYDGIADLAKSRISQADIERVIKIWFSADVTDSSIIYLPCYRVVLQSKDSERTLRINAANSKVF